jgi:hypothetical protein
MKTLMASALAISVLCAVAWGQNPSPSSTQRNQKAQAAPGQSNQAPRIAPGSVLPVELTKTIDAKKAKPGDQVEAKVTQDLKAGNGELLMAKDTRIIGHVTEAQAHSKEQKESQLGIAFDHATLQNGVDETLPLSIQAVIAPPSLNPGNNYGGGGAGGQAGEIPTQGGMSSGPGAGRSPGMGQAQESIPSANTPSAPAGNTTRPPITANTQGVIGISNLKLASGNNSGQGSVLSSEKSNVKLESGTLMLLRVSQ